MGANAIVDKKLCTACGSCVKVCPSNAISVDNGVFADIVPELCVNCGKCGTECPGSVIDVKLSKIRNRIRFEKWYDYLWIFSIVYLALGFFNIMFAWIGLICFFTPLLFAVIKGNKGFCNKYCDRGQLLALLGGRIGLSRHKDVPNWLKSNIFRYAFLIFFFAMFFVMLWNTYLVFAGVNSLSQVVTLLWTFKLPWHWAYHGSVFAPWVSQFAFGFYGVMLTSTVLGLITMILFKPRSWCVYCPMGTMTQLMCKIRFKIFK